MTAAILGWQVVIFATIALAGRWRGWMIAVWVAWTLAQVAVLPLSVIQFGTIAFAALMFPVRQAGRQASAADMPRRTAASASIREVREPEQRDAPRALGAKTAASAKSPPLLKTMDVWATDLERKTKVWSDEGIERNEFKLGAMERIKTEGFSCALEEEVMRGALAADQRLKLAIEAELAKDPILAKLYWAHLAEQTARQRVLERQVQLEVALKAARSHREILQMLVQNGSEYRETYYEATRIAERVFAAPAPDRQSAGAQATIQHSVPVDPELFLFGRHMDDWVSNVEAFQKR